MSEPQAINHRELEYPHPDAEHVPPEMRDTVDLVRWAEHVNRGAGLAICAALLEVSGSLKLAASTLEWADWSPPATSYTEDELDDTWGEPEACLRLWVEKNREDIEKARGTLFCVAAMSGRLMERLDTGEEE
jgi:hypothetical protein